MSRIRRSPQVAVVGAGIIGCTIAWKIRQALGFDVDLYERRDDILLETTAGTQYRSAHLLDRQNSVSMFASYWIK